MTLVIAMIDVHRSDRLEKWDKKGVIHQFVNDAASFVDHGWVRRLWSTRDVEQTISHASRNINLARRTGDDVDLHESLPKCAEAVVAFGTIWFLGMKFIVDCGVALRVKSEF